MAKRHNLDKTLRRLLPWSDMSHAMMVENDMSPLMHNYITLVRESEIMTWLPGEMQDILTTARNDGRISPCFESLVGTDTIDSPFVSSWNAFANGEELTDDQSKRLVSPMIRMFESELISCLRDASRDVLKVTRVDLTSEVSFAGFGRNVRMAMRRFNDSVEAGTSRPWYAPIIETMDGTKHAFTLDQFQPYLRVCGPGKTRFMTVGIEVDLSEKDRAEEAAKEIAPEAQETDIETPDTDESPSP